MSEIEQGVNLEEFQSSGIDINNYSLEDVAEIGMSSNFATIFNSATPLTSSSGEGTDVYGEQGEVHPESISPTHLVDEAFKSVLAFTDVATTQLGMINQQHLGTDIAELSEIVELITIAVNALLGIATGSFSFNLFSFIGSVLGALGFSALSSIFNFFGGAAKNYKTAMDKDQERAEAAGRKITEITQKTAEATQRPNIESHNAPVYSGQFDVKLEEANVAHYRSAGMTISSDTIVETSTDKVQTSSFYKLDTTQMMVTADNSHTLYTAHSTRYHPASVIEYAGQAEYIHSSYSTYADFRWEQTGQGLALPINANLGDLIKGLFSNSIIPLTGISVEAATHTKLTTARYLNMNYGAIYTIDGVVLINSGIGKGILTSLPLKSIRNLSSLTTKPTTTRTSPEAPLSVNELTPENIYHNVDELKNYNLGQLLTDAKAGTTEQIEESRAQQQAAREEAERRRNGGT